MGKRRRQRRASGCGAAPALLGGAVLSALFGIVTQRGGVAAASEICPGLLLGDYEDARNTTRLSALNVTRVVNVSPDLPFHIAGHGCCHRIPVRDETGADLQPHFDMAAEVVAQAWGEGRTVLCHCALGQHRSPAVAAAVLVALKGLTAESAIEWVQSRRPWDPTQRPHFERQLAAYARRLRQQP
eukprot:TRINITY_DN4724_c0_g1_i1.p2 TRINITY_DN4724_c0_g1~~TRINITY_DN4724_c0_g1_i1.p2  ORF type:complete len:209 (+),score=75.25 TRINITY_DN4724_c0_g1_i1:74-628(+)